MNNKAIVISEDHYNALGMIRSLGEKGFKVSLILTSEQGHTYTDKSKYVSNVVFAHHVDREIVSAIMKLSEGDEECFLFPLSDYTAKLLDENYTLFGKNVVCPNMKGKMFSYQNKITSKELAGICGMKTAKSILFKIDECNRWECFPAIIKPLISQEGAKSDITIVNNNDELKSAIECFKEKGYTNVLIEEYLTGKNEHMVEVLGCSYGNEVFIGGIVKKIREYPMKRGSTSFAEIVKKHEDIDIEAITKYIKYTKFDGLFDVEFKYVNGSCYFIECNFRNGAPGYALTQAGCNLPYNWIAGKIGKCIEENNITADNVLFMCEQTDLINVIKREIPFRQWIKEYKSANKVFKGKNDSRPVVKYYFELIRMICKRLLRRRR